MSRDPHLPNPENRAAPGPRSRATPNKKRALRFHPDHALLQPGEGLHAERLYGLLGREHDLDEVGRALRFFVSGLRPPVVGAFHVSCSDEAERECVEAFQRSFVRYLLPSLKFFEKSAFRTANLGGRYEWGSVAVAEDHYADACRAEEWKVMLVKVSSHVSVEEGPDGPVYGKCGRYLSESVYCGALHALMDGNTLPFGDALREAFELEGSGRLEALCDPSRVDQRERGLFAAIVNARLQARCAMMDVQDHAPRQPTLYLVVPCVSLNRAGHDTEIVVGLYAADRRAGEAHDEYCGLGDDPARYKVHVEGGKLVVTDPELEKPRVARSHRALVLDRWLEGAPAAVDAHPKVREAVAKLRGAPADSPAVKQALLRSLLAVLVEVSPVPAAALLFGQGLVGIHHAARAHRLHHKAHGDEAARRMLAGIQKKVDALPPETAEHLVQLIAAEYAER